MREALSSPEWLITEDGVDPERANVRETLCTVGNVYLGTSGTLEEGHPGDLSGTYLAGVYDAHDSPVVDLVNAPDWLSFAVFVDGTRYGHTEALNQPLKPESELYVMQALSGG